MEEVKYKICGHCKEKKAVDNFNIRRSASDGLSRWCKNCSRASVKQAQQKNRKKNLEEGSLQKTEKVCSCCEQEKNSSEFHSNTTSSDGLYYCCRDCAKKNAKMRRERSREKFLKENQITKKVCKCCNKEKKLSDFCNSTWTSDHLNINCRECSIAHNKSYRENNKEVFKKANKESRKRNPEKHAQYEANWKRNNKEKNQKSINECIKRRKKIDPSYRLRTYLRGRLWNTLSRNSIAKSSKTMTLLGCSIQEFRQHLESQFTEEMSWENYGRVGWHIDHIRPCASFNLAEPEEQKICFHHKNMQPMWASENIKKSSFYMGKKYAKGHEIIN